MVRLCCVLSSFSSGVSSSLDCLCAGSIGCSSEVVGSVVGWIWFIEGLASVGEYPDLVSFVVSGGCFDSMIWLRFLALL